MGRGRRHDRHHTATDWTSTAYSSRTLPSRPVNLSPAEQRLAVRIGDLGVVPVPPPGEAPMLHGGPNEEMRGMCDQHRQKIEGQRREGAAVAERRRAGSQEWSRRSAGHARELRGRCLQCFQEDR